ncbi:glycoside hydrolase [Fomitiporia mediterranea MF3/22]|uniref:Glycoside hydrolase n=1 Tax=Fomitiporia mediterranea (strain MF3/22) TaxID=694068 RepID=R7SH79_FOMME|nr:glycoside hydrolase [Fomitiporia mediterranea MF3/22]EJC97652.1 glycoside hydrolase [Fomitiporia mediterranea MF3/22]
MTTLRTLMFWHLCLLTACAAQSSIRSATSIFSLSASSTLPESSPSSFIPSMPTVTSAPATVVTSFPGSLSTTTTVIPTSAPFIPIGSIPRTYKNETLDELWNLAGEVEDPPFTTTVEAEVPVTLPASAPPVYPTWYAVTPEKVLPDLKLPKNFKFGVVTAAYQVEGAVKLEGKGPTNWDWAQRQPGFVIDDTNGDITDLQYLLYKNDTARTAALGFKCPLILDLVGTNLPVRDERLTREPAGFESLFRLLTDSYSPHSDHWDMPLALSAYYGGMTSEEFVGDFVKDFATSYATTVFKAYNGRVKQWYTFNEPHVICSQILEYPFNTTLSPNVTLGNAMYHCAYYLLKAHAGAVKAFREMGIEGEIAFKNDGFVGKPWQTNTTEDFEAVERNAAFYVGMFSSADFFAIDLYRGVWIAAPENEISACAANSSDPNWPTCNVQVYYDSATGWPIGYVPEPTQNWLFATPQNLRYELKELKKRWPYDKIYISEFGFPQAEEGIRTDLAYILDDADRTNFYMTYLGEFLLAIHEDNIPLAGTFAWAMVDTLEWNAGTSTRFGIQNVNYTTLERHFKRSALALFLMTQNAQTAEKSRFQLTSAEQERD